MAVCFLSDYVLTFFSFCLPQVKKSSRRQNFSGLQIQYPVSVYAALIVVIGLYCVVFKINMRENSNTVTSSEVWNSFGSCSGIFSGVYTV